MQDWNNKIAETLLNLEELQLKVCGLHYMESDKNLEKLCWNNKNIKVLVFNRMIITEESCRVIANNCKKVDLLTITFLKSNQAIYER